MAEAVLSQSFHANLASALSLNEMTNPDMAFTHCTEFYQDAVPRQQKWSCVWSVTSA